MAYLACNKDGTEVICEDFPSREQWDENDLYGSPDIWDAFNRINLPKGSIAKLIGRELTWSDEPVELKDE